MAQSMASPFRALLTILALSNLKADEENSCEPTVFLRETPCAFAQKTDAPASGRTFLQAEVTSKVSGTELGPTSNSTRARLLYYSQEIEEANESLEKVMKPISFLDGFIDFFGLLIPVIMVAAPGVGVGASSYITGIGSLALCALKGIEKVTDIHTVHNDVKTGLGDLKKLYQKVQGALSDITTDTKITKKTELENQKIAAVFESVMEKVGPLIPM